MKCDESETKIRLYYRQCPWTENMVLRTTILKITSECFVIARTNYVNLNAGHRSCKWNFKLFEWFIDTANQSLLFGHLNYKLLIHFII